MDIVERLRAGFMGSHILSEAADEIERLRKQVEDLALVARGAAYRIKDTKKSQRFLAMIDRAVGKK